MKTEQIISFKSYVEYCPPHYTGFGSLTVVLYSDCIP